jgi:hypothetical protein
MKLGYGCNGNSISNKDLGGMSMREVLKLGSFILIFIGTLGLLLNEFMFDWGRTATLIFAAINVVGLVTLVSTTWITKKARNR